jgi:hypothetical protein
MMATSLPRMPGTQHWRGLQPGSPSRGVNAVATYLTPTVSTTPPTLTEAQASAGSFSPGENRPQARARAELAYAGAELRTQAGRGAGPISEGEGRVKPPAGGPVKSDPLSKAEVSKTAITNSVSHPITLPLRTVSGMNAREHPMARSRRVKAERATVAWSLVQAFGKRRPSPPLVIRLTRYAPSRGLDSDNLQSSLKAVRDAIAQWMGINDADETQARYAYAQARAPLYAVRIEFLQEQHP